MLGTARSSCWDQKACYRFARFGPISVSSRPAPIVSVIWLNHYLKPSLGGHVSKNRSPVRRTQWASQEATREKSQLLCLNAIQGSIALTQAATPSGEPHTKVFNTWFFGRSTIVDIWGLGGPGDPKNLPKGGGPSPKRWFTRHGRARGRYSRGLAKTPTVGHCLGDGCAKLPFLVF